MEVDRRPDPLTACTQRMDVIVGTLNAVCNDLATSVADSQRLSKLLKIEQRGDILTEMDVDTIKEARNEARKQELESLRIAANERLNDLVATKNAVDDEKKHQLENVRKEAQRRIETLQEEHANSMQELGAKKSHLEQQLGAIEQQITKQEDTFSTLQAQEDQDMAAQDEIEFEETKRLVTSAEERLATLQAQSTELQQSLEAKQGAVKAAQQNITSPMKGKRKRETEEELAKQQEAEVAQTTERLRKQIALLQKEIDSRLPEGTEALQEVVRQVLIIQLALPEKSSELVELKGQMDALQAVVSANSEKRAHIRVTKNHLSLLLRTFASNQRVGQQMHRVMLHVLDQEHPSYGHGAVTMEDLKKHFLGGGSTPQRQKDDIEAALARAVDELVALRVLRWEGDDRAILIATC